MTESANNQPERLTEDPQEAQTKPILNVIDRTTFRPENLRDSIPNVMTPVARDSVSSLQAAADSFTQPGAESTFIPQEPSVPFPEHHKIPTKAKVAAGVFAAATTLGGAALIAQQNGVFESNPNDAIVEFIPAPSQPTLIPGTEIPNPLKTPETTPVPTPKVGFSENNGVFTFRTEKGDTLNVPQIEGLIAKLVKVGALDEVQYFTKEGNAYGIEANKSVGEYKPNVDIYENSQRKELGGVVLSPQVAKKLMDDTLAKIPEQSNKWIVVLPVDISSLSNDKKIMLFFENSPAVPTKVARLSFQGALPVVDIIPGDKTLYVLKSPYYNMVLYDSFRRVAPYGDGIYPGKEINYLGVSGNFTGVNDQDKISSFFGKKITDAVDKVNVSLGSAYDVKDITRDKILSVGDNIPVFLQASSSGK